MSFFIKVLIAYVISALIYSLVLDFVESSYGYLYKKLKIKINFFSSHIIFESSKIYSFYDILESVNECLLKKNRKRQHSYCLFKQGCDILVETLVRKIRYQSSYYIVDGDIELLKKIILLGGIELGKEVIEELKDLELKSYQVILKEVFDLIKRKENIIEVDYFAEENEDYHLMTRGGYFKMLKTLNKKFEDYGITEDQFENYFKIKKQRN